jgi:hypothetical protein
MDWLNILAIIVAILFGPVAAVQVDRFISRRRERMNRKHDIFKTLMATRGNPISYKHVEALNRIDLEFSDDRKYKKVVQTWKEYFDNLSQNVDDENRHTWSSRNEDLLANLLLEMSRSLGYDFDKVLIKRNIYYPKGQWHTEQELDIIRRAALEVLLGQRSLPFHLIQDHDEEAIENQRLLQKAMIKYYMKQAEEE